MNKKQITAQLAAISAAITAAEASRDTMIALYNTTPSDALGDAVNGQHDTISDLRAELDIIEREALFAGVPTATRELVSSNID